MVEEYSGAQKSKRMKYSSFFIANDVTTFHMKNTSDSREHSTYFLLFAGLDKKLKPNNP